MAAATETSSRDQSRDIGNASRDQQGDQSALGSGSPPRNCGSNDGDSSQADQQTEYDSFRAQLPMHTFERSAAAEKSGSQSAGARPKSSKVLIRKNTPALLPKVERLYAKDKFVEDSMLCEEEEEEEEEEEAAADVHSSACSGTEGGNSARTEALSLAGGVR